MTAHAHIETAIVRDLSRQIAGGGSGDPFRVGEVLIARTGTDASGERTLVIAGVRLPAVLPPDIDVGRLLRLQVKESEGGRLVLQVLADLTPSSGAGAAPASAAASSTPAQQASALQPQPTMSFVLPDGATVTLWVDPERQAASGYGHGQERGRSMVVRYDGPTIGRTDIVLQLDPERLDATVLAQGPVLDLVRAGVPVLRQALAAAVERPVAVVTGGRGAEDLDVRA